MDTPVDSQRVGFQRARSDEQRGLRRRAILRVAAEMVAELPVAEISLRELSKRVGLAKSNVLRYFESREAVFLELLDVASRDWLAGLAGELSRDTKEFVSPGEAVGAALAASPARPPLLCEPISVTPGVPERNISLDVA